VFHGGEESDRDEGERGNERNNIAMNGAGEARETVPPQTGTPLQVGLDERKGT